MATQALANWAEIDWERPSPEICAETGAAPNTVSKLRKIHAPETSGKFGPQFKDKAARQKRMAVIAKKHSYVTQPKATAAAKVSDKAGKGVKNVHAKKWTVIDPEGEVYEITNLYQFVRDHSDLFAPADVVWKRSGGKRGTGGEYCNATAGLLNIKAKKTPAWKGWALEL